jgi:hypothetical protein
MIAATGGLVLALLASTGTSHGAAAATCGLGSEYQVLSVSPLRRPIETGGYGGTVNELLRGADIRVAARPGLTQEWLERRIEGQVAAGECRFGTDRVHVDVLSEGETFIVRVTSIDMGPSVQRLPSKAPDERAAKQILQSALELTK